MASSKWQTLNTAYSQRIFSLFLFILPPLLAVLIYAPTISHPLMYDTLLHTQLADGQTLLSVFLPDERFGFYRPLVFFPIVFFQNLLGYYPAWLLHWINIVTHALNALLLTKFVWRTTSQKWQSLTAGLLFATFPFAYQALAIYGNNPYLTVTFFILLGLNISTHKLNQWLLPIVFVFGVLVHETAVLLIPLVLFLAWTRSSSAWRTLMQDEIRRHGLLYATCSIYLIIYLFLPRGGGPTLNFGGNALLPKILLFLQTVAWPFVLILHRFLAGQSQITIIVGFGILASWGTYHFWASRKSSRTLSFEMGLCWFLLASILIGVTLPTYYIEDGARLLYPGAAGVALLWSSLLTHEERPFLSSLFWIGQTAMLICLIAAGAWFNRRMITLYEMGSRPIHTIGETLSQERSNDDLILINLPQWVAWPQQIFPAGTEFAPIMGSHLFAAELVRANYGLTPQITILDVPEALAQTPYTYGIYRVGAIGEFQPNTDQSIQIVATEFAAETPLGRWHGSILADEADATPLWSAESIDFLKQTACITDENSIIFTSVLRPKQPLNNSTSIFVQALSAEGLLIAQNDGPPLGISPQRLKIAPNTILIDHRFFIANEQAATILSGVYDFVTGEREEAFTDAGDPLIDKGNRTVIADKCHS